MESTISELKDGGRLEDSSFNTADSLIQQAKNEFDRISNEKPTNPDLKRSYAQFFQNSAAKYQKVLSYADQQKKQQLSSKIEQYLSSSIPLFEELAEQQPEEQSIWKNLYQAYTYLGMEEKAEEAKSKF
jgi:predicted Zn-dependent protease